MEAGAAYANYTMLRLPHGLPALFENWLDQHFPEKKDKILSRVRAMRGGAGGTGGTGTSTSTAGGDSGDRSESPVRCSIRGR